MYEIYRKDYMRDHWVETFLESFTDRTLFEETLEKLKSQNTDDLIFTGYYMGYED
ncbi:hypothetical protein VPHK460_0295 [Vibrio phage K460]